MRSGLAQHGKRLFAQAGIAKSAPLLVQRQRTLYREGRLLGDSQAFAPVTLSCFCVTLQP